VKRVKSQKIACSYTTRKSTPWSGTVRLTVFAPDASRKPRDLRQNGVRTTGIPGGPGFLIRTAGPSPTIDSDFPSTVITGLPDTG
jgi:hypothetical protein